MKRNIIWMVLIVCLALFVSGCKVSTALSGGSGLTAPPEVTGLTGQDTCLEGYTIPNNGWQLPYDGGYVAHCDDRRYKGQNFKCKLDYIDGYRACTVAVKRKVEAPSGWTGNGPMPVNFSSMFPGWQFGTLVVPSGSGGDGETGMRSRAESSGDYGEVVAAKAWQ